ncbi:MAG: hypothetical protein OEY09_06025, partial [Gammaproteobacteria bacterium]|nr:hypothetical protein [Gammaproteobacteria bacterium]
MNIASMDIPKLPDNPVVSAAPGQPKVDLAARLTQLGSIEARVVSLARGQLTLSSQLGQITGLNTLDLKSGDRVQIRLDETGSKQVLKVTSLPLKSFELNATSARALASQLVANKPVAALVVSHKAKTSLLQLGDRQLSIPQQAGLPPGQLVSLTKSESGNQIDIRPLNHQQVLKSALSRLLPAQTGPGLQQSAAVTQLVKLIHTITGSQSAPQNIPQQSSSMANTKAGSADSTHLLNQFTALLATLPKLSDFDRATLQQWVRPTLINSNRDANSNFPNPYRILQQLPKSEALLVQLLQQAIRLTKKSQTSEVDLKIGTEEPLQTVARDMIKMVDQSINQQLLQQTSLRYQQELQQPIALNLSIPIVEGDKTRELKLKIRQHSRDADPEKQSWDIYLDFEFGLLGMISTHLMLEENTLSASFWSVLP